MKKILIALLALVAVFCTFVGCSDNKANDGKDNNTNVTDDTGNGENTGTNDNTGGGDNGGPNYTIVNPITDGGSFTGDNYN